MPQITIPGSLKRFSRFIDEIEDYRDQGPDGDGYWVHLKPGFKHIDGVHSVHEDNITQCADVFKSGFVVSCECVECKSMIEARKGEQ